MNLLRCPACYQDIKETVEKCNYCSTPLVLSKDSTHFLFAENNCLECKTSNPPEFKFCGNCGSKLTQECPNCGLETHRIIVYCGRCTSKFPELPKTADQSHAKITSKILKNEKPSVLVVDDEPYITKLIKQLLELEGMDVAVASNGKEALEMMENFNPTLVITDMMMPELSGYDLIRELRASPKTQRVKIIMLTVIDALEEVQKTILQGADDYICKPFDPQELLWSVKRLLGKLSTLGKHEEATT